MATIKAYIDISQSKTLSKILPFESADMVYLKREINDTFIETPIVKPEGGISKSLPCWSLSALLDVLPERTIDICYVPNLQKENSKYSIAYGDDKLLCIADNPVDACVAMIERLHELNLL